MTKNVLTIDNPVSVKGLTIIPVVRFSLHYSFTPCISVFSIKQPIAAIVISPLQRKALRITGEEIPLEQLLQEVPEIKKTLEKIPPALYP
jgi:uncharacterized spore protein YtfJ